MSIANSNPAQSSSARPSPAKQDPENLATLKKPNWTKKDYQEFRNYLFSQAEEGYRDFVLTGTITERPYLGVRVPKCRQIAKAISGVGAPAMHSFLSHTPVAYEEVLIRGFVISSLPYKEMLAELYDFITLIDNWGICDCFCASLKTHLKKHKSDFLSEIDKMLNSLDEFQTRVALVCLLDHYVEPDYLAVIFDRITEIAPYLSDGPGELSVERIKGEMGGERVRTIMAWDAYYVKMAVAWLISVCFAKFPEETTFWFRDLKLPKWTYNKSIAKTCESYRVDRDLKAELKSLKH